MAAGPGIDRNGSEAEGQSGQEPGRLGFAVEFRGPLRDRLVLDAPGQRVVRPAHALAAVEEPLEVDDALAHPLELLRGDVPARHRAHINSVAGLEKRLTKSGRASDKFDGNNFAFVTLCVADDLKCPRVTQNHELINLVKPLHIKSRTGFQTSVVTIYAHTISHI